MAHIVKCFFCGQNFDRDKVPFVQVSVKRYAHKTCASTDPRGQAILQAEKDKDAFYALVKQIYGADYNYMMINQQATSYIEQYGYTWSGMTGCLHWFYEINHGSLEEGHGGIGIIPYIYEDVKKYYQNLYLTQEKNKNIKVMREPVYFNIQSPRAWQRPPHLLDLGDETE